MVNVKQQAATNQYGRITLQNMPEATVILYVGNNHHLVSAFRSNSNTAVITAGNWLEAMNTLTGYNTQHAVVCEYHLPGKTGLFLYEGIRSVASLNAVPFILLSATFNEELYKQAINKKIDDFFVSQNVDAESLLNRIHFLRSYRKKQNSNIEKNSVQHPTKSAVEADVQFAAKIITPGGNKIKQQC